MGYGIECKSCQKRTKAWNIVDLIDNHTEKDRIICNECKSPAYIYRESKLQEKGEKWRRWIKGVIRIYPKAKETTYYPYVFLTAQSADDEISGIHFGYYKDTTGESGGKLKHGHGPGGSPVFTQKELILLLEKLIDYGCLSTKQIEKLLTRIKPDK